MKNLYSVDDDPFLRAIAEQPTKSIQQLAHERAMAARKRCGILPSSQQAEEFREARRKAWAEQRARQEEEDRRAIAAEKAAALVEDLARKQCAREFAEQWINTNNIDRPLVTFTLGYPLSDPAGTCSNDRETFASLCKSVCEKYLVSKAQLQSGQRHRGIIQPRQELYWLCRHRTFMSWNIIGRMLHKDHTSVIHGCHAYEQYQRDKAAVLAGHIKGKQGIDYLKVIGA